MPWGNDSSWYGSPRFHRVLRSQLDLTEETGEEGSMLNRFRVGCDPEFVILDSNGRTVPCSSYFPQNGEIGWDHGGRVAEFRPSPSRGVFPLMRRIQTLVQKVNEAKIPGKLRAGAKCNTDCLGGHIHFGFDAFEVKPSLSMLRGDGRFNTRGEQVTKALDTLTATLEHLDILPQEESKTRRKSSPGDYYGAFGDVRDCHGHMEYRTMASWLYDPKVAFLCLTAAKLAAVDPEGTSEALQNCKSFAAFEQWLNRYKTKDINATRASEKLLDKGLAHLQIDPSVDFRGRWERLGI